MDIKIPRNRNVESEPKIFTERKRNADGLDENILYLYAAGMTKRDISEQIRDLYDFDISVEFVFKVTDKLLP